MTIMRNRDELDEYLSVAFMRMAGKGNLKYSSDLVACFDMVDVMNWDHGFQIVIESHNSDMRYFLVHFEEHDDYGTTTRRFEQVEYYDLPFAISEAAAKAWEEREGKRAP